MHQIKEKDKKMQHNDLTINSYLVMRQMKKAQLPHSENRAIFEVSLQISTFIIILHHFTFVPTNSELNMQMVTSTNIPLSTLGYLHPLAALWFNCLPHSLACDCDNDNCKGPPSCITGHAPYALVLFATRSSSSNHTISSLGLLCNTITCHYLSTLIGTHFNALMGRNLSTFTVRHSFLFLQGAHRDFNPLVRDHLCVLPIRHSLAFLQSSHRQTCALVRRHLFTLCVCHSLAFLQRTHSHYSSLVCCHLCVPPAHHSFAFLQGAKSPLQIDWSSPLVLVHCSPFTKPSRSSKALIATSARSLATAAVACAL